MFSGNPLIADIDRHKILNKKLKILHLEDLYSDALLINKAIKKGNFNFEILVVNTKDKFIKALAEFAPDIILADHSLPSFNSIEALAIFHETGMKIPFILITGAVSEEFAVDIMKRGADDYIIKDRLERLPSAINNALEKFRLKKQKQLTLEIINNSEKRFRALIETGADAVLILTAEGKPTYVSPSLPRILGYTEEETKHLVLGENIHPDDQAYVAQKMGECLANPGIAIRGGVARVKHKNGTWVSMDATLTNMLHDPDINGIINNTWDVTESKLAEQKILHANRLYAFISQINQAIVHIKDEQTLFNKACTIAVEYGKFSKAFIGITDSETKKIKLTASYGMAEKDLEMLSEYDYENDGPIDKAMKGFDYVTVNDIKKAPQMKLKKYAEERGLKSCIFLAIKKGGKAIGIFNIYSTETDFFTSEEIRLLIEVTGDISFAIDIFEKDKQKKKADEKLRHSEFRLNQAQSIAHIGSWEVNLSTGVTIWSNEALKIFGIPPNECQQTYQTWISYIHPEDRYYVEEVTMIGKLTQTPTDYYCRIVKKDGTIKHIHTQTKLEFDKEGNAAFLYGTHHDVTEMKVAEDALKESEIQLKELAGFNQKLIDVSPMGIASYDATSGHCLSTNSALAKIVGTSREEVLKQNFRHIDSWKKSGLLKDAEATLASGKVHYNEINITTSFANEVWMDYRFVKFSNKGQTLLLLLVNEITERKQAENALRESESNMYAIFENTSDGFILADNKGIIKSFNNKSRDLILLNIEKKIHKGDSVFDFIHESWKDLYKDSISKVLAGEVLHFDYPYTRKNGETKWFSFTVNPVYNGNDITGLSITSSDITERKIAENKLIISSAELQKTLTDLNKILDSSLDVICTINGNGEFVNVSVASQQIWGYTPEELIGSKFMNLVYDEDADITSKATEKIVSGIPVPIFENRYVHKSGKVVPLLWSINWDEKLKLMFCITKDVTEKKRLEKAVESERDQFFDMFLKAPSAIGMLKGPDHVFEMVNPLYLQLIGKKDVIGKTVAEVLPEVIEQGFIDLLDIVYKSGKSYTGKEILVKIDNEGNGKLTDIYLNILYQAYKSNEGNIAGVFFFANDITEQILSRKKIEKSEKFFKGVIENSDDMITILDLTGNTIYASPAVSKKFGYTAEECLSINIADIVHPDDAYIMQEFVMKVMMHPGVPMQCPSIRDRKKDGTYIWVTGTLTNFLDTEGINAIVANFRDITEKKKLEDLLEKTNRLARIGGWEIDVIKGTVFWSDITKEIREVEPDFIPDLSMGIQLFKEGDHRDTISKRVRDCKEKGIPWDEELQIFTQKGNLKWIRTIGEAEFIHGKCVRIYGSFQDIDAKKKAEKEILKAHEEKNIILESIGDAFFAVDRNWVITYWNSQAEKMLVKLKSETIGNNLWEVFSESVDSVFYTKYHHALENNEIVHFEDYYGQLDKWYEISVYPSVNGLSVYFKDETERKHAEQNLKSEKNLLRTLIDSLPDAIYFKDNEAKKLISNKFDYQLLGAKTEAAVLGKTDLDMLPANIGSITYSQDMEILRTGSALINIEEYFTPKNRKPLWLLTTKLPLRNEKNKIIGLLGIGRDITEEKVADGKLQLYLSNLKAVIDNTDASIYSLDRDFRYIIFNQLLHDNLDNLYGLDIKVGDNVYDFLENLEPEEAANWEVIYSKALTGETVKFEREFKINDFYSYIGFSIYPIWENEKVIGLSCFAFDITKKKQEDIQKEKITDDLIQRNKDLEQFSYIVSHNLRSPVANIIGLSEELTQDTHSADTNKMLKKELSASVKRLDNVILDLNNILKVNGGINEKKETVRLLHMIESIQSGIRNLIRKEKVKIKTDFSIINEFTTVKSYLYSIFYNLILNSIKYHRPGLMPLIEIKSEKCDGKLIITFKDNGTGIDMAKNGEHVFGLYKRFHKNIEGKGMGLFMVKAQVETLGGKIAIKSELNKGTEFTIEFTL